jgi:3',5'-cyclic-AMP phosphodiesterase
MMPTQPYFVQLTDTHLFADPSRTLWDVSPDGELDRVVAALRHRDHPPALVLVTGDCSGDGSERSYRRLAQKIQSLGAPVYFVPGNHDDPALMARLFSDKALNAGEKLMQVVASGGWRFILLDSSVAGQDRGTIGAEQLAWLRKTLAAEPAAATMVIVHHNPLPVGSEWLDTMTIADASELLAILDAAKQVRAVLYGHVHQEFAAQRGGTAYMSAPSTFFQFKPGAPSFCADSLPPGARVVHLNGASFSTSVLRVT